MDDATVKLINDKKGELNWYNHQLRDLKDYVMYGDDEQIIKENKGKIEEYEKCVKILKRDIILIKLGF